MRTNNSELGGAPEVQGWWNRRGCIAGAFLLVSLVMNLLCSCFSPIASLVLTTDPACFYMQGHAWAEGMVPYVDFVDVKGPLLFFLYRLASMLTPGSTLGCYLMYSCAGAASLYLAYRTGVVLLKDRGKAFVAAMAMLPVMFWWQTYGGGGESEELMAPFFALLLYAWFRYMERGEGRYTLQALSACVGLGAGVTLLIKYNCTFVFAVACMVLAVSLIFRGRWKSFCTKCFPWVAVGFAVVVAPFAAYLWGTGTLQACWDVYVVMNFSTYFGAHSPYSTGSGLTKVVSYAEMLLRCREGLWASVSLLAACFYPYSLRRDTVRCTMLLFLLFAAMFSCLGRFHDYYLLFCTPACIVPVVFVFRHLAVGTGRMTACLLALSFMYMAVRANGQWAVRAPMRVTQKLDGNVAKAEKEICSMMHPKILYLGALDRGFGVSAGALPACPEWCTLNGVDDAFMERQRQAVIQRKADFIVVLTLWNGTVPEFSAGGRLGYSSRNDALCEANGYTKVCTFADGKHSSGVYSLYSRKKGE